MSEVNRTERPFFPPYLGFDIEGGEDVVAETPEDRAKKFIESSRSEETVRKTKLWVKRLREYGLQQTGKTLEALNKNELNSLLCTFLIDANKTNGESYETTTVHCMFSILNRFFKDNSMGDLEEDTEFQGARDVKRAKLKLLKTEGKGKRPNHATALTKEEEELLYSTGQLGLDNPDSLQRTVWWQTTLLFGHRGRNESRQMKWGDVKLDRDASGREFLEFSERSTKTRDGNAGGGSRAFAPKAFECPENPSRCPVRAYKEFARRRPAEMMGEDSPFYLAINHRRRAEDAVWYARVPLGKNTLGNMLKIACQRAGIAGQKTNHSARKTCVKRALETGCPREFVAQLTGHKNVNSLENYAEADVVVQKAMCSSLQTGAPYKLSCSTAEVATTGSAATNITFNISNCGNVTVVNK